MGMKEAIKKNNLELEDDVDMIGIVSSKAKNTYIRFSNPRHPYNITEDYENPLQIYKHYKAAKWLQSKTHGNGSLLIGRFLWAVYECVLRDNEKPLDELVEDIKK